MAEPVPAALAALALTFAGLVVLGRRLLVRETVTNRLVNRAITWSFVATVIEECGARTEFADLTFRLFLGGGVMAITNLVGVAVLFDGADEQTAGRRQRRYDTAGAIGAVIVMVLGRPSDPAAPDFSWQSIVFWAVFNIPTMAAAVYSARACVRELRFGGASVRQRSAFAALLAVSGIWAYSAIADGFRVLSGRPSSSPGAYWTVGSCVIFVTVVALTAVPLVKALVVLAEWDQAGRHCRQLRPLWRDLTTAVPSVVLHPPGRNDAESRRYRMVVEIEDALLHLKKYAPVRDDSLPYAEGYARQIAAAAHGKSRGITVSGSSDQARTPARDLSTSLDQLLILAKEWPRARGTIDGSN